ncbi:MAG: hypothetical protein H0X25_02625 [Acidobacteriales bacterium]|nr:hypothetical protein [Terriglobales bacterium]
MPGTATPTDAELILKLYDLRRETEIRKARTWWLTEFWPQSVDDIIKVANAMGSQENNWMRQVGGYWEMAAAMVLHGAINLELFLEGSISGEMFFIFSKVKPFLPELREKMNAPNMFGNVEKVINSSEKGKQMLKMFEERVAARSKAIKESAKA